LTAVYILWRIIQNLFLGSYDPAKVHHWTTVEGVDSEGPTDMAVFEKLTLWPLIIVMFVLGIYPTLALVYFNGFAVNLLQYIQGLL
jgi:NADH:ubiquinone oxidoreductase subunit 4 (subunit M)